MNRRYFINILATQDLKEIADYFTANSVEAGELFFRKFDRRCEELINFPRAGRSYKYLKTCSTFLKSAFREESKGRTVGTP